MRFTFPTHTVAAAAVIAGGAIGLLAGPGSASAAALRYASPSGWGTACTSAAPCSITQAITAASSGDEVIVEPGDYPLTATLTTPSSITVHGVAGQPRPRLQFSGAQLGLWVDYSTLRYVEVDQAFSSWAVQAHYGTVDQVVARGPSGAKIQSSTIRDSVAVASAPGGIALGTTTNGATNASTYRNVTAVATGSGGVAIEGNAMGAAGNATITLTNAIARTTSGPAIEALTDNSGAHATITADHSNFASAHAMGTNAAVFSGAGNQTAAPGFLNEAAGDYREVAGSPTIDAGIDDPLNGALDFEGNPRTVGTTDIGADEYVPPPTTPAPAPQGSTVSGSTTGDTSAPSLTLAAPKKESVRKGRVYLFATSNEGAGSVASGKVAAAKLAKSYRLGPASKPLSANTRTKITLKIPAKTLRAARSALARHETVKATLVVQVKDSVGNATSKQLKVRLTK